MKISHNGEDALNSVKPIILGLALFLLSANDRLEAEGCTPRLGVQTHFAQGWSIETLRLAERVGAGGVRDGIPWHEVEPRPGYYEVPGYIDTYLKKAAARNMKATVVFTGGNPLYDEGYTPYTAEGRQAFASFVAFIVQRYRNEIQAVEIGNEFNGSFVTGPATDNREEHYAALLREVYHKVKQVAPEMPVLGGAAHSVPIGWFQELIKLGAADYMDGIVVHPYREIPEFLDDEIEGLKELFKRSASLKPIHATEVGIETDHPSKSPAHFLKLVTLLSASGVCDMHWYALRDEEWYANTGLFTTDAKPKPAASTFEVLVKDLLAFGPAKRLGSDALTRVYRYGDAGPYVVWGAGHSLAADDGAVFRDATGTEIPTPAVLSDSPIIVESQSLEIGHSNIVGDTLYQYAKLPWTYRAVTREGTAYLLTRQDWVWSSYLGSPLVSDVAVGLDAVTVSMTGAFSGRVVEKFRVPETGRYEISGWLKKKGDAGGEAVVQISAGEVVLASVQLVPGFSIDLDPASVVLESGAEIAFVYDPKGDSLGDVIERRFFIRKGSN